MFTRKPTIIGYWREAGDDSSALPDPSARIDLSWDLAEREQIAAYLAGAQTLHQYRGCSPCRICGKANGSAELGDGHYIRPEGLGHYVLDHAVRLDKKFIKHVRSQLA